MREVRLYGHLGKRFGRSFHFDVRTPAQAIAALRANLEGFARYMMLEHSEPGYHIMIDKRPISEAELAAPCGGVIKIIPAVAGAKKGGVFQTIFGAVLIVAGVFMENPYMVSSGIAMVSGGVIQMLTRVPNRSNSEKPENMPSYAFNGPVNTTSQGNPVPVCYGEMIVGSQVGSFGLSVEDMFVPGVGGGGGGDGSDNGLPYDRDGLSGGITNIETSGQVRDWNPYDSGDFFHDVGVQIPGDITLGNNWRYDLDWTGSDGTTSTFRDVVYDSFSGTFRVDGNLYPDAANMSAGDTITISASSAGDGGAPRWSTADYTNNGE